MRRLARIAHAGGRSTGRRRVRRGGRSGNGLEAVSQYEALRPDLVLLDLVMPQSDGREALARILELDPQARVVILSSLGAQSDIEQCLRLGARSYLQKPIDPEAMERVLHQVLA